MAIERELYSRLRSLDRHELRRALIFVRGLLVSHGDDVDEVAFEGDGPDRVTYRLETVRCGKEGCKSCPHGPYWYAYYREGNRLKSRYIGRDLSGETLEAEEQASDSV